MHAAAEGNQQKRLLHRKFATSVSSMKSVKTVKSVQSVTIAKISKIRDRGIRAADRFDRPHASIAARRPSALRSTMAEIVRFAGGQPIL